MREIKFRALNPSTNEYHYADVCDTDEMSEWITWDLPEDSPTNTGTRWDVEQFTGLKSEDKELGTGEEIYTDDFFEITDGDGWVVGKHLAKMDGETLSIDPRTIGKVLGNIHQNNELLESQNEPNKTN